jgi:pimeloyl-ACP methyl ester carboxylesterase
MPVSIIVGAEDRLVDAERQSGKLHGDIRQSRFHLLPGAGHMIHQTATRAVMSAIEEVATSESQQGRPEAA